MRCKYLFLLIIILYSAVICEDSDPRKNYLDSNFCEIQCNDYCDQSIFFLEPDYIQFLGYDLVYKINTPYNFTNQLKEKLSESLNQEIIDKFIFGMNWRRQFQKQLLSENIHNFCTDTTNMAIYEIQTFSDDPDFLLAGLDAYCTSFLPMIHEYWRIAYMPEMDTAIFLNIEKDFKETYKFLMDNSKDLQNMNPICAALLLLNIKYNSATVYLLESGKELATISALMAAPDYKLEHPNEVTFRHHSFLYQNSSRILDLYPKVAAYINGQKKEDVKQDLMESLEKYNFHLPKIKTEKDRIIVKLIILGRLYSNDEIVKYEITLTKDNHLISINKIGQSIPYPHNE